MEKTRIGIVGLGAISKIYLENITKVFLELEIVAVCDILKGRAKDIAEEYNIQEYYEDVNDLMLSENVEIILNLTRPTDHYKIIKTALQNGKHVYSEKPLVTDIEQAEELIQLAKINNLMLGCAPDTFMGAGIQTCRKIIEDGYIGKVVATTAHMLCRGHESWHPQPDFYYQIGGGPMMDMGPYYLTTLINLVGKVKSVYGSTQTNFEKRVITSDKNFGKEILVEVPTHVAGIINYENGAVGTIVTSFDVYEENRSSIIIYGEKGTLYVPDPNMFSGKIELMRPENGGKMEIPLCYDYKDNYRGLGLADMGKALRTGRDSRANAVQGLHVLEIMKAFEKSSESGRLEVIQSNYTQSKIMKNNKLCGILD